MIELIRKIIRIFITIGLMLGIGAALYYGFTVKVIIGCLLGAFSFIIFLRLAIQFRRKMKYLHSGILQLDEMTGVEFEEWFACKFEQMGYKTTTTITSNDYGADIIAWNKKEKLIIQTKRYADKVGIKAVQEVIGAVSYYADEKYAGNIRGIVITNSWFTSQAINLAERSNIELWDRDYLLDNILK